MLVMNLFSTLAPCCFHGEGIETGWMPAGSRRNVSKEKPLRFFEASYFLEAAGCPLH